MANSKDDKSAVEPKEEKPSDTPRRQVKLTEEQRQEIVSQLEIRGVNKPCSRCGNNQFQVLDAYFSHFRQLDLTKTLIGGPSIPCAVVICKNCGCIFQHALGAIDLLGKGGEEDD